HLNFSNFFVALLPFPAVSHLIKQGSNISYAAASEGDPHGCKRSHSCCILAAPARRSSPANRADSHVARRSYASPPFCVDFCRVGFDRRNFVFRPSRTASAGIAHCPHATAT